MTEIPEHLLARSKARRAAAEGGGDGGEAAAAPKAAAGATTSAALPATVESTASPVAAAAPAAKDSRIYAVPEIPGKRKIPLFAMPAVIFFPFWILLYLFSFGSHAGTSRPTEPLALGKLVYVEQSCSGCHGAGGEGGVGPKLAGGQAVKTFPIVADHISWVKTGSGPFNGQGYGDPEREGGQHVSRGVMPAFAGKISEAEIAAVVAYEREGL